MCGTGLWLVFLFSVTGSMYMYMNESSLFCEWMVLDFSGVHLVMVVFLDWMSCCFVSLVGLISGSIFFYSCYYMSADANWLRFMYIMLLFIFSMWLLIISPNLVSMMLGWDGLGLTSFFLVIYYQNPKSISGGTITLLSNRVGDVAILGAIVLSVSYHGWSVIYYDFLWGIIMLLIILAAMTKSAQAPFSAWLPEAMAAPTPVSALVHSSTLVTAGVYILIRFGFLITSSSMGAGLVVIGLLTSVMAGLSALFEPDMKKVVALSTLSQLGLMVVSIGAGYIAFAFFHLLVHAVFKSLLFMMSGVIIHESRGSQDLRGYGGVLAGKPYLAYILVVSNVSLCGIPYLAGYFSKDVLLESSLSGGWGWLLLLSLSLCTGLTVAYSLRCVYQMSESSESKGPVTGGVDLSMFSKKCSYILLCCSVVYGFLYYWLGFGYVAGTELMLWEKASIFLSIGLSIFFSVQLCFREGFKLSLKGGMAAQVLGTLLYLSVSTGPGSSSASLLQSKTSFLSMDKGWLEVQGPTLLSSRLVVAGRTVQSLLGSKLVVEYLLVGVVAYLIFIVF